jgi:exosortase
MNGAAAIAPSAASAAPAPSRLGWMNLGLLATLGAGLIVLLWPQWLHNPDLSHGLFMPVIFVLLVHEARTAGPFRYLPATPRISWFIFLALLLGLLALVAGGMYAMALEWSHALVGFVLAAGFSLLLLAGLLAFSTETARLIPWNWTSLLAVGLWALSAPIPPGTYSRLTVTLQLWVSENVVTMLHLLGIAAIRHGNIIELTRTSVGIEEACSGVRSLVSCVFAGFFFSGCLVRRPWARVLIIGLAAPLALLMNFIRSLTLTLLANGGVDIRGRWHDLTGFAVLAITAALLGGLALLLEHRGKTAAVPPPPSAAPSAAAPRLQRLLVGGLLASVFLAVFFVLHTLFTPAPPQPPLPDLDAVLPAASPGWQAITSDDLNRFKDVLQTDHFIQRTYIRRLPNGTDLQITAYIAYWGPGQASASLVATHTPDACWPGSGWESVDIPDTRETLQLGPREIAAAEHRLFRNNGFPQHVWFWHLYDRQPVRYLDPLSTRNLLKIAALYGFRRAGDQMFVRLSSNHPWPDIAGEPLVGEIFAHLQPLGL